MRSHPVCRLGIRATSTSNLIFQDVKIPKENLLGKQGEGFKVAMTTLDAGRIGIAAQAIGIGRAAFECALAYSKERESMGVPIAKHQVRAKALSAVVCVSQRHGWVATFARFFLSFFPILFPFLLFLICIFFGGQAACGADVRSTLMDGCTFTGHPV